MRWAKTGMYRKRNINKIPNARGKTPQIIWALDGTSAYS